MLEHCLLAASEADLETIQDKAGSLVTDTNGVIFTPGMESPRLELFAFYVFVAHPTLSKSLTLQLHQETFSAYMTKHSLTCLKELLTVSE
jgi:hypothetical protein